MASQIILRVQSPDGTTRIQVFTDSSLEDLYESVRLSLKSPTEEFTLYLQRNSNNEIPNNTSATIKSLGLKHGDIIYFKQSAPTVPAEDIQVKKYVQKSQVVEDEVDVTLGKMDGSIPRKRDDKLCRHGSNGCCVHCSPIEPWDDQYLKDHKIKHMSFHAYLRKITSGVTGGKFAALEDMNCCIKRGCTGHLPWPKGICSKCQPSAITLNPQNYRHVDNIVFENASLVEQFLNYWRVSGHQRIGYLYGTYDVHTDVPLGLRANIVAIYEPPQESARDFVKLLNDPAEADVSAIAESLGLQKVGWIFTDLIADKSGTGMVKQIRGKDTYFLSSEECILAGNLQNKHPNKSKYSSTGIFGSKFVTVCVTGDANKQIHMEGYAVSAQCMALVRDNCLIPTKDAPELGYIRETSDKQFVPDVFYKQKDQYGNEVQRMARPLPVEYLLVDIPTSTPRTPMFTFTVRENRKTFPIANRYLDGHIQDFDALCQYLSQWSADEYFDAVNDFHFLLYLYRMEIMPMRNNMDNLLVAVRTKNRELLAQWKSGELWSTLESLISTNPGASRPQSQSANESNASWTCNHCTFINSSVEMCEMCGLPR